MNTTKWIPGVTKLMHIVHGEDLFTGEIPREDCEREGWRAVDTSSVGGGRKLTAGWLQCTTPGAQCSTDGCVRRVTLRMGDRRFCSACGEERGAVDQPIDAPAEKRERTLSPGWSWHTADGHDRCRRCGTTITPGERFVCNPGDGNRCLPCAEAAGAFAPPAPAKPVRPADDDHAAWAKYLPTEKVSGSIQAAPGVVFAWCVFTPYVGVVRSVDGLTGEALVEVLAGDMPSPQRVHGPTISSARLLFPADAARAKPAEPKPAPAEKAKREWKAPREMEGGVFRPGVAAAMYAATMAGEAGPRLTLLCNLAREKPPARVFPETRYNAPTDAHGKLSRLVESGLRADVRLDETSFEAGLRRGAK